MPLAPSGSSEQLPGYCEAECRAARGKTRALDPASASRNASAPSFVNRSCEKGVRRQLQTSWGRAACTFARKLGQRYLVVGHQRQPGALDYSLLTDDAPLTAPGDVYTTIGRLDAA